MIRDNMVTISLIGYDNNGKPIWRIYRNKKAIRESEITKDEAAFLFRALLEESTVIRGSKV